MKAIDYTNDENTGHPAEIPNAIYASPMHTGYHPFTPRQDDIEQPQQDVELPAAGGDDE